MFLKGERGEPLVSHFVFCITGEVGLFACQKGKGEGHGRDGGNWSLPVKQFCSLYSSCQVKQSGDNAALVWKLQNVSRAALKASTDATYHQQALQCDCIIRREIYHSDVYITEVLVSVRM